ncbi:SET domain-containing protein [Phytoactinopolyspora halotolerans]|uniref:SET domain-containing protein n=1 Tax=Phytoactinopolyspora halotolerans TaxID=1981512 RepID=A0A6L9S4P9_9ACTN|nr:SET domain-containing protein-lysine N-methyltransferase [Phytoactinopolyspora halotolerans]NEE00126.1 SET domain-containing protein [Phytoactinopolyspora halotolerans]
MVIVPDPECWLSEHVEVRDSPIQGSGLFARVDIARGTPVARLGGRLVSNAELQRLFDEAGAGTYVDTVSVHDDVNLVLPSGSANHWGNHSCEPTLWWTDPYTLQARFDIVAGTELTVDYGALTDDPYFEMECRCGATFCRGEVTGLDWQRPELQTAYGDHWVPVLRERIRADAQP